MCLLCTGRTTLHYAWFLACCNMIKNRLWYCVHKSLAVQRCASFLDMHMNHNNIPNAASLRTNRGGQAVSPWGMR